MAETLSVDLKTIGNWERGETMMNIEQLCRCCEVLGCTPNDMTGWYLEHPEDLPRAAPAAHLADPYQAELNACWEESTADGRSVILGTARGQRELSKKVPEGAEPEAPRVLMEAGGAA